MNNTLPAKEEYLTALEQRHGKDVQKKFSGACVAICGLGGLGSNVAISLARAGVGKLILIDFDKVDLSNIHRQQYSCLQIGLDKTTALKSSLEAIAPYSEIISHTVKLTEMNIPDLLADADIICEAFDVAEEKAMLVNSVLETFPDKYLVSGSGMAGFAPANDIKTQKITNRFYLCGDGVSDVTDGIGLISSRVMICAAHQAHIILRILAGLVT